MDDPAVPEPRWLTEEQQKAWRALVAVITRLPAALDTQLQRDYGLTHFDYFVLGALSEADGRRLKLRDLATTANASLSRLSHVVTKLEKGGWVKRASVEGGRGSYAVLTDSGWDRIFSAAPGHVATVRALVFDGLTDDEVASLHTLGTVLVQQLDKGIADGIGEA